MQIPEAWPTAYAHRLLGSFMVHVIMYDVIHEVNVDLRPLIVPTDTVRLRIVRKNTKTMPAVVKVEMNKETRALFAVGGSQYMTEVVRMSLSPLPFVVIPQRAES